MKKKILILLTLILFAPFAVNAKDWTMDWQKSWGGNDIDSFEDIFQTQDGGFIIFGSSYSTDIEGLPNKGEEDAIIVKYDKDGNLVWQKSFGGNEDDKFYYIYQTQDGGFIASGYSLSTDIEGLPSNSAGDAIIVKYDKDGNLLWKKWNSNLGSYYDRGLSDILLTQDGGFIAYGNSGEPINGTRDATIVKYDKDGNLLWQRSWGGSKSDGFSDILETSNGGFIAFGSSSSKDIEGLSIKGYSDAIMIKYDKDGNLLWQKSWGGSDSEVFDEVLETSNGGFIVSGSSSSTDIEGLSIKGYSDEIIVKFDKDGNMVWQKSWGGSSDDRFNKLHHTQDGGFIAFGSSYSTDIEGLPNKGSADAIIVKYDKDGNMVWQKSWGGNAYEELFDILLTQDGGFITYGYSESTDIEGLPNKGYSDAIIVKYDKDGNIVWQTNWGGIESEGFQDILLTQDGFIASGLFEKISNQAAPLSITQGVRIVPLNNSMPANIDGLPYKDSPEAVIVKYSIKYDLENTTTENGASTVEQQGKYGIITPTPNEGYEVDKIIIKDKDGNVLDLVVTKQQDGTYTFELSDDVSIEVLFKKELVNPKTGVSNIVGIMFTMILMFVSAFFVIKNFNNGYEL